MSRHQPSSIITAVMLVGAAGAATMFAPLPAVAQSAPVASASVVSSGVSPATADKRWETVKSALNDETGADNQSLGLPTHAAHLVILLDRSGGGDPDGTAARQIAKELLQNYLVDGDTFSLVPFQGGVADDALYNLPFTQANAQKALDVLGSNIIDPNGSHHFLEVLRDASVKVDGPKNSLYILLSRNDKDDSTSNSAAAQVLRRTVEISTDKGRHLPLDIVAVDKSGTSATPQKISAFFWKGSQVHAGDTLATDRDTVLAQRPANWPNNANTPSPAPMPSPSGGGGDDNPHYPFPWPVLAAIAVIGVIAATIWRLTSGTRGVSTPKQWIIAGSTLSLKPGEERYLFYNAHTDKVTVSATSLNEQRDEVMFAKLRGTKEKPGIRLEAAGAYRARVNPLSGGKAGPPISGLVNARFTNEEDNSITVPIEPLR